MENIDPRGIANGLTREGAKRMRDLKQDVEDVAETVSDQASVALQHAREVGVKALDQIYDQGKRTAALLSEKIKKDPVSSVAIAAGVGILCGMLVRRFGITRT